MIHRAERLRPQAPESALRQRAERLQRVTRTVCRAHNVIMHIEGVLPASPAVIVSNHLSYIDPLVLLSLVPAVPIAKHEVRSWPLVGAAASSFGVLFVERRSVWSGARVIRAAVRALAEGVSVLGFPEGTTTDGTRLLSFRRGLFGVARLAGVSIIPVAMRYPDPSLCWYDDQLFIPHYLRTAFRRESHVEVRIGAPIDPVRSADELATLARNAIQRLLWRVYT